MTTEVIDARGLRCPLPVLKTEKRLAALPDGAQLVVLATDPMAKVDIPLFCARAGHACTQEAEDGVLRFSIVRGGGPAPSASSPSRERDPAP